MHFCNTEPFELKHLLFYDIIKKTHKKSLFISPPMQIKATELYPEEAA